MQYVHNRQKYAQMVSEVLQAVTSEHARVDEHRTVRRNWAHEQAEAWAWRWFGRSYGGKTTAARLQLSNRAGQDWVTFQNKLEQGLAQHKAGWQDMLKRKAHDEAELVSQQFEDVWSRSSSCIWSPLVTY